MMTASRRKKWAFRAVALGGAFGLALVLAEVGLWVFAPLTSNEWLYWEADGHLKGVPEPNQVLRTGLGGTVRINSLGFRGPDYAWTPAAGTLRVAAFGGSSTFGFEADDETTWPRLLEMRLAEALKMPVEVINLGVPGYDTSTSKINYLQTGRALHPQVVLLYHTWNDIKFFRPLQRGPVLRSRVVPNQTWRARLLRHTQLARRLSRFYRARGEAATENQYTSMEKEGTGVAAPVADVGFDWARQNFVDFVSFVSSDGRLPVLITQATAATPENTEKPEYRKVIREDFVGMTIPILAETWLAVCRIIEEVAAEHGAVVVDGYSSVPHDLEHMRDHTHMTEKGRRILANAIAETMLQDERFKAVAERVRKRAAE